MYAEALHVPEHEYITTSGVFKNDFKERVFFTVTQLFNQCLAIGRMSVKGDHRFLFYLVVTISSGGTKWNTTFVCTVFKILFCFSRRPKYLMWKCWSSLLAQIITTVDLIAITSPINFLLKLMNEKLKEINFLMKCLLNFKGIQLQC